MEDGDPEAHVQVKVVRSLWCHEGVSERTCEQSNQSPIRRFSLSAWWFHVCLSFSAMGWWSPLRWHTHQDKGSLITDSACHTWPKAWKDVLYVLQNGSQIKDCVFSPWPLFQETWAWNTRLMYHFCRIWGMWKCPVDRCPLYQSAVETCWNLDCNFKWTNFEANFLNKNSTNPVGLWCLDCLGPWFVRDLPGKEKRIAGTAVDVHDDVNHGRGIWICCLLYRNISIPHTQNWLVVWNIFYLSTYWE